MNLLTLTETKLASLHHQAAAEIARRAKAATNGHDPASIIAGNEMAKRALVVGAAGGHSILFVGPPNCGKTMLRAVALELGLDNTFETRPCPCGFRNDPLRSCNCKVAKIERWAAAWPAADVTVEVFEPKHRELNGPPGTTLADLKSQIARMTRFRDQALDEDSTNLLKCSCVELGIDPVGRQRIIAVARTIANLDRAEQIGPAHICEAINYRMFRR